MKSKNCISLMATILFVLLLSGCPDSETSSQIIPMETTNTATPTPTPTSAPTPIPSPTPTPEPYQDLDEEMLLAPDIPGLTKQVQKQESGLNKVVYIAAAENEYGLAEGSYAGEYKKNVLLDSKETGGVALIPPVVEALLNQELGAIPLGNPKIKIILPMDISKADEAEVVVSSGNYFNDYNETYTPSLDVSCSKELPILWVIPDTKVIIVFPGSSSGTLYDTIFDLRNWQYGESEGDLELQYLPINDGDTLKLEDNPMSDDNLLNYLTIHVEDGLVVKQIGTESGGFGYVIAEGSESLMGANAYDEPDGVGTDIVLLCQETSGENYYAISSKDILTIEGVLVFATQSA